MTGFKVVFVFGAGIVLAQIDHFTPPMSVFLFWVCSGLAASVGGVGAMLWTPEENRTWDVFAGYVLNMGIGGSSAALMSYVAINHVYNIDGLMIGLIGLAGLVGLGGKVTLKLLIGVPAKIAEWFKKRADNEID